MIEDLSGHFENLMINVRPHYGFETEKFVLTNAL